MTLSKIWVVISTKNDDLIVLWQKNEVPSIHCLSSEFHIPITVSKTNSGFNK